MEFWIFAGIAAFIIIMAEYARGKESAETRDKIDEMHKWMRKCHPYKFNGMGDRESAKIEFRDSKRMQDNLPNEIDLEMTNRQNELARKIIKERLDNNLEIKT